MCQLEVVAVVGSFRCGRATEAVPRDSHDRCVCAPLASLPIVCTHHKPRSFMP